MLPKSLNAGDKPWEVVIKFTTASSSSTQAIIGGTAAYKAGIVVFTENKVLKCGLSGNGTSWNISSYKSGATLTASTVYYIKAKFTGSAYEIYYRTENSDWTLSISVASTTSIYQDGIWRLGSGYLTSTLYTVFGSIDFKESYINIDGKLWWNGTVAEEVTNGNYDFTENKTVYLGVK